MADAGFAQAGGRAGGESAAAVIDIVVVDRYQRADSCHRQDIVVYPLILFVKGQTEEEHQRVHEYALEPTEFAGVKAGDIRVEQAAHSRYQSNDEGENQAFLRKKIYQFVSPILSVKQIISNGYNHYELRDYRQYGQNVAYDVWHNLIVKILLAGQGAAGFVSQRLQ